jgi:hypothetical protein
MQKIRYLRVEEFDLDAIDDYYFPSTGQRKGWIDPERALIIFDPYYSSGVHEIDGYIVQYYYFEKDKSFYEFYKEKKEAQRSLDIRIEGQTL